MAAKSKTQTPKSAHPHSSDPVGRTVPGIHVRSFADTFRRAGLEFTSGGIELRLDDLTGAQEAAIRAEPMLSVKDIDIVVSDAPLGDGEAEAETI
ncbi:MAG TPA: HI1506-related protein [Pseudomonas sp.]|uniref:HI1506-related protein n=1 Tax=Pseudomonas sp. TaxID=306 RepID=UPI002C28F006|nr:HI1506-related protein [Pseudomonas sp.]HWH86351.1 HI1506-related protein [Pseudomonas sp.]